jgi:AcrR family transcriptional regulator
MKEPSPRRERQIAERMEQIQDAAARLFAMKGFHRTTTREIAEAAEVSEGSIYNYFENKNDLLFSIIGRLAASRALGAPLAEEGGTDTRQLFLMLFKRMQESFDQHNHMQQAILAEVLTDCDLRQRFYEEVVEPAITSLEEQIQSRISTGTLRPIDARMSAHLLISIWFGYLVLDILDGPAVCLQWDELTQTSADILFEGLHPKKD